MRYIPQVLSLNCSEWSWMTSAGIEFKTYDNLFDILAYVTRCVNKVINNFIKTDPHFLRILGHTNSRPNKHDALSNFSSDL